jgi:hypothetical protein
VIMIRESQTGNASANVSRIAVPLISMMPSSLRDIRYLPQ